jgi:protein-tyrosine-phosphatase
LRAALARLTRVPPGGISSILFVCGRNAVRSPMAEALAGSIFPGRFYVRSAGVAAGERDPFVDAVLAEAGLSLGDHRPRQLEDLDDTNFDLAVTLSPEAHHRTLELTRTQAIDVEYWPTPDPTLASGSREQILAAYRELRERLAARIRDRLAGGAAAEFTHPEG